MGKTRAGWAPVELLRVFVAALALWLTGGCSKMVVEATDLSQPIKLPAHENAPLPNQALEVTFFGNSTLLISDGETRLMVDGYLSRPGLLEVVFTRLSPDRDTVQRHLDSASVSKLDAVVVAHSHYDHVLDAALVAHLTGATLVGSIDTCRVAEAQANVANSGFQFGRCEGASNKARPAASPPDAVPFDLLTTDKAWKRGNFTLTAYHCAHGKYGIDWLDNALKGPVTGTFTAPAHVLSFKEGVSYTLHVEHPVASFIIQTSAGLSLDMRDTKPADFVFLTTALVDKMSGEDREAYWDTFVTQRKRANHPIHVIPIHWDSLFSPLEARLDPLPDWITNQSETKNYMTGRADSAAETHLVWMEGFSKLRIERGQRLREP